MRIRLESCKDDPSIVNVYNADTGEQIWGVVSAEYIAIAGQKPRIKLEFIDPEINIECEEVD